MGGPTFGVVIPATGPVAAGNVFADAVDAIEGLGYADVWFGDHVAVPAYASHLVGADWREPVVSCAAALARTRRLRAGTDVLVLPYRHPLLVAKMAATIDALSGGRLVLGVGVGYLKGEFAALGADYDRRGAVCDDYLEAMEALWAGSAGPASSAGEGKPASFAGRFARFDDIVAGPPPVAGRVPVWVGGNNPAALRRAAAHGDGWHPLFPTTDGYRQGRDRILAARSRPDPITFSMSAAVTRVLEDGATFNPGFWSDAAETPDDFGYAPPVPTAPDGRLRFVGDPDQVAADVADYVAAGVEHFTLRFSVGGGGSSVDDYFAQIERFASEVLPRFAPPPDPDGKEAR